MYQVHYHWDQLKHCVVGKSYPPEFYSWIKNSRTRKRFEQLAEETEQDFNHLIALLQNRFGVTVTRPRLPENFDQCKVHDRWVAPPVTPRDYFVMIGHELWVPRLPNSTHARRVFGEQTGISWSEFQLRDQAQHLAKLQCYQDIFDTVQTQGNSLRYTDLDVVSGCFVSRLGKTLYFATQRYDQDQDLLKQQIDLLFPNTDNRVVNAGGHGDSTYCPVTPGLIISLRDVPTYADTFPGWEVVYLPPSDYASTEQFRASMKHCRGRWNIPGFEDDSDLVDMVETYFGSWVGNASETVFDVNILVVDPKNIIVSSHNDQVESACARHGIEVHVSPFRHRYFWDSGIHCITNDLHRMAS